MNIDKQAKHIAYNDSTHKYWNITTDEQYVSVTTLIGHYKQPFDEDFFSEYKAIERLLGINFNSLKSKVGYKQVPAAFKKGGILPVSPSMHNQILAEKKAEILAEWAAKRDAANRRGTEYHRNKEEYWQSRPKHILEGYSYTTSRVNTLDLLEDGIYPELLLYNDTYKLAGQADLVIKKGNLITIRDYKTNETIDKKSYQNPKTKEFTMMQYPLNNIQDCNYQHYTLQLSTYAWMIEELGYRVVGLYLDHIDHSGKEETHKLNYKKSAVLKMLNHYGKNNTKATGE